MPINSSKLFACSAALVFFTQPVYAERKPKLPDLEFSRTVPPTPSEKVADGAIFNPQTFIPLTNGNRAARVGDVVTIVLAEHTTASKSSSASTGRDGSISLTPPTTGPLDILSSTDVNFSGGQSFKGKGETAQTNNLTGELSVTISEVFSNGTMSVKGEKLLRLNRGDERVQMSGLIRAQDISSDNRILSTRVADAKINYVGKGDIARASKQGWLQRFFSIVSPF